MLKWRPDGSEIRGVRLFQRFTARRRLAEALAHQELSLDLFATANFEGFFTRLNPAWSLLGYSEQELLARPFLDFVHPDDREPTLAEAARQTEAGEQVLRFENRYRHKDGSYRWLEWTSRPDARRRRLIAVARDITVKGRDGSARCVSPFGSSATTKAQLQAQSAGA